MLYDKRSVDLFQEKKYLEILLNGKKIDFSKLRYSFFNYSYQHFLLKCYSEGKYINECIVALKKIYEDFLLKPYVYVDSPLIKTDVLNFVFKDKKSLEILMNKRNSYFLLEDLDVLFEKYETNSLSEEERDKFYSTLLLYVNSNDIKIKEMIEIVIKNIIDSERKTYQLSDMELKFYSKYVSNFVLKSKNLNPAVFVGVAEQNLGGEQFGNCIGINKFGFCQSIEELTTVICHESRHSIQCDESKKSNSKIAFDYGQSLLFSKYLNTDTYNSYKDNYNFSRVELDAEKLGYWNADVFFRCFKRDDLAGKVRNIKALKYDKRNLYECMLDTTGMYVPLDSFVVTHMDEIMKSNPYELENYPVFKQIYNKDGSRKSFSKLVYSKMNENIENKGVYDNYIRYGIMNDQLNDLNFSGVDSKDINKLFKMLADMCNSEFWILNDYYKDNEKNRNKKQVSNTTKYHINLIAKILRFVEKNYDLMVENLDESLNNQSYIFQFGMLFRDFDFDKIKNDTIRNDNILIDRIDKLNNLGNQVMNKFNYHFIKNITKLLTKEELEFEYYFDGYGTMMFKDYLYNYLLKEMDGHQEVFYNGEKKHIVDVVNEYKNIFKNNSTKYI